MGDDYEHVDLHVEITFEKVYVGTKTRKLRLKTYFNMLQWKHETYTIPFNIGLDAWDETP